jgi:uncharacterized protein
MRRDDVISRLKTAEPAIRALGAAHLLLFGSVARDEAGDGSDVDVFIDRDPSVPFGMMELTGLGFMLEEVLGTDVDVGTRGGLHPAIRASVEQTAIQVF